MLNYCTFTHRLSFLGIEEAVTLESEINRVLRLGASRFIHDPIENEKLRSKGIAMHVYGISVYYALTGNQLNALGQSRSTKGQARIELCR